MDIFKKKSNLDDQIKVQSLKIGLTFDELKKLYQGKSCPKYGVNELLHVRKARGGKIVVFNISEKFRGEKISDGRRKLKSKKEVGASEK